MPTAIQAKQAVVLLHWISKGFQQINVFRYDQKWQTIYVQAGENDEIAVVINSDGRWNFV
ncbi:MAG: hypothetical protein AB4038_09425 [Prochloraceae cyanobacterium]